MVSSQRSGETTVGISGIGYYIPKNMITSREMAQRSGIDESVFSEKIGIERKHIADPDEHPADMGIKAARQAIKNAGIAADEIDIIVYGGLGFYDYNFWSPAAKIQDGVGASRASTFEIRNGCNGGNLGLPICKELLLGDPQKKYAMVVCSDKLSLVVNYTDPTAISSFTFADGAVAAVLKKNHPENQLLSYASISDGSLVDYVKVPCGGTRIPLTVSGSHREDCYLRVTDPKALDGLFSRTYLKNYVTVIHDALKNSGYTVQDIDHIFTNQVKKSITDSLLLELGLEETQTMRTMKEYGHMGPADTLFCLALAQEEGRIRPGDLVVLAGSGIGFTWAATVLKFR
ncbi:MAG: 3-oxoacyl-ACP synthase [Methanoregula sp.]|jgi:3-oxoacyl-[acyl-carrier-protein] synthase-3|nr:3-oxoacyl-ACP synthase [Methanoregula sp.]